MLEVMDSIPLDIQNDFGTSLYREAVHHTNGIFKFTFIRRTDPDSWEAQRIRVLVVDEENRPIPGLKIAFSYDTAHQFLVGSDWVWTPPRQPNGWRADIFSTEGSGQIDHIQGSTIPTGGAGGVTVFVAEPGIPSDHLSGCGMLAEGHVGQYIVFQLRRPGVVLLDDRLANIEARLDALEAA